MTSRGQLKEGRPKRLFTPARLVALALIVVLAATLAYVRFDSGPAPISAPAGAKAGNLMLKPGSYSTENGRYPADVGTLVVPENRAKPDSRLIALPLIRIRARSAHPGEPIFRLEGGPGITNMKFPDASRLAENHDVVLVGYRGVDGSVRLGAPEVEAAIKHSGDLLSEKSVSAVAQAYKTAANRFQAEGIDVRNYGLVQQVDDLEAARVALGYGPIDLLSESAGTRTAQIYSWRYPQSIHRSVMIGVNPPGNYLWHPDKTDELLGRYSALYTKDKGYRQGTTGELADWVHYTSSHLPNRWLFLPIKKSNVRVISLFGLMESTPDAAPASGPMVLDSWLSAAKGDASGLWFASVAADLLTPEMFVWGQYAAAGSIDAQAARDYFSSGEGNDTSNLGVAATSFVWVAGRLGDVWPVAYEVGEYNRVRTSNVETLLVGGDLDFSTPPQIATKELLPYLPNGHQVVLHGFGHTMSFWTQQPEAGTRLLNTFFDTGKVDNSLYKAEAIDFTPTLGLGWIAKIALGVTLGIAILTVVSLACMARRVHRRGPYGRTASFAMRSLYPIVLGLGGWFIGGLIVMTTMPSVPLENDLLAAFSAGIPVALGTYFAWVNRDWSANTKWTGFVAALGAALVGAWLGFNTTNGALAVLTAVVGAIVGANLILLALDIARDRQPHAESVESRAQESMEERAITS